ncbi:MAG: META domain-containing protein [Pseudomonadota bacterium]|nr:META domain-containing protein [Pseudomonadota bacterium]
MKKLWFLLLILMVVTCGKELSFKGKEYTYQTEGGLNITLGFDGHTHRYFGKAVNQFFGTYQIKGNNIKFQYPTSTMKMGSSTHMHDEEKFFNALEHIDKFQLKKKILTFITTDGKEIVMTLKENMKKQGFYYEK